MSEKVHTLTIRDGEVTMPIADFFILVSELIDYGVDVAIESPTKAPGEISFRLKEGNGQ